MQEKIDRARTIITELSDEIAMTYDNTKCEELIATILDALDNLEYILEDLE